MRRAYGGKIAPGGKAPPRKPRLESGQLPRGQGVGGEPNA